MQRISRQLPSQNGAEWACVRLGDIFKKVSRRNADGVIKNVITNSAEYGLIPQRDFFDKDIAVGGNTANYYVIENGDFVYNPRKSILRHTDRSIDILSMNKVLSRRYIPALCCKQIFLLHISLGTLRATHGTGTSMITAHKAFVMIEYL